MKRILLFIFISISLFNAIAQENNLKGCTRVPQLTEYINLYYPVLSDDEKDSLAQISKRLESEVGSQLVVLIQSNIPDGFETIEEYSLQLASCNRIGRKFYDDGVLISIYTHLRKLRIEVGGGLELAIPDSVSASIIQEDMVPSLIKEDYYHALQNAMNKLDSLMRSATLESQENWKTLDFGLFEIDVPRSWSKYKINGIDSYVGGIKIDDRDSVIFDLGWYSNTLEKNKYRYDSTGVYIITEPPTTYKRIYTEIDERKAKIIRPLKLGDGLAGVYFDSLWVAGSDIDKFEMHGRNLSPEHEVQFVRAIQSLRFKSRTDE